MKQKLIAIDVETSSTDTITCQLAGIGVSYFENGVQETKYLPVKHTDSFLQDPTTLKDVLIPLMAGRKVVCHNGSFDAIVIKRFLGIDLEIGYDTFIMGLLQQEFELSLEEMVAKYVPGRRKMPHPSAEMNLTLLPQAAVEPYCKNDCEITLDLCCELLHKMENEGQMPSLELEMEVYNILWKSELRGYPVDLKKLNETLPLLQGDLDMLEQKIFKLAGMKLGHAVEHFKLNSTKKLGDLLFSDMGIVPNERFTTKTGYSTAVEALESLDDETGIIEPILEWKGMFSINNSLKKIPERLVNGRLHPGWKPIGYMKGSARIYSESPSLTQLPKKIRECIYFD